MNDFLLPCCSLSGIHVQVSQHILCCYLPITRSPGSLLRPCYTNGHEFFTVRF